MRSASRFPSTFLTLAVAPPSLLPISLLLTLTSVGSCRDHGGVRQASEGSSGENQILGVEGDGARPVDVVPTPTRTLGETGAGPQPANGRGCRCPNPGPGVLYETGRVQPGGRRYTTRVHLDRLDGLTAGRRSADGAPA